MMIENPSSTPAIEDDEVVPATVGGAFPASTKDCELVPASSKDCELGTGIEIAPHWIETKRRRLQQKSSPEPFAIPQFAMPVIEGASQHHYPENVPVVNPKLQSEVPEMRPSAA